MDRIRIDELALLHLTKHGRKPTYLEIGEAVFRADKGRPYAGRKPHELSPARKQGLIGSWNRGFALTAVKPRHLLRLAEFFEVKGIKELLAA